MDNNKFVIRVTLSIPALEDNRADADRLTAVLKKKLNTKVVKIDLYLLRILPEILRQCNYSVRCILFKDRDGWILSGITKSNFDNAEIVAGVAVDLGTTKIVLRLLDLETGNVLGETAFDNPQISIGPDVLARIHYANKKGGLEHLRKLVIQGLNNNITDFCSQLNLKVNNIYSMAIAGNTAMTHLFMGLDPSRLIREPYIPVVNLPDVTRASELGLELNPGARVFIFPNIGSYFGGDLIAGIVYCGMNKDEKISILVDVGTNAEVVLGNNQWLMACAGAAGPALEGGVSKMGMMAGPGVIDRVVINPVTLSIDVHTIDNLPPRGICGSGLIDLAAQLFLSKMIDIRGKLVPKVCGKKIKTIDGINYLILVPDKFSATGKDLTISQIDLNSLRSSKAAMYTILEVITATAGLTPEELQNFYVAGTFGCFIDPKAAITIGMLPDIPLKNYKPLGNSSLEGASMALVLPDIINEIDKIRDNITYLELNVNQEFMNKFSGAKFFPHTDSTRFPSVVTCHTL